MSGSLFEGKSVEEAIEKAEKELGITRDSLRIEVLEEKDKGILGLKWGKRVCIKVTKKPEDETTADIASDAAETLGKLISLSGLRGEVESRETFEEIILDVKMDQEDDESLFIGRRGKNIDAYQYIVNKIIGNRVSERIKRIIIDCAGYRAKRTGRIERMARKAAYRVRSEGSSYTFPPMEASERRIVHMTMKDEGLQTESRGQGNERKVVVFPPDHTEAA